MNKVDRLVESLLQENMTYVDQRRHTSAQMDALSQALSKYRKGVDYKHGLHGVDIANEAWDEDVERIVHGWVEPAKP